MKKLLLILSLFIVPLAGWSQDDDTQEGGKIQERMRTYIQEKLGLSKAEAQRFTPVFIRYIREFAQTHRQYKPDPLVLKQKIIELRLRFRPEFRQAIDEARGDKVYHHEDIFRREARKIILENRRDRGPVRRNRAVILD